ncbi:MAG: BMC domain-containing protein [Clostridia bacterium]|nr:BMC domain-containing protein [Clostridia bacterium]
MNIKAIGLIEVSGSVAAIDALDIMCKAANVTLITWEKKLGGRLVTVVITGDVSDVTAAVNAANASCIVKPAASAVIPNPHEETKRILAISASNHNIE